MSSNLKRPIGIVLAFLIVCFLGDRVGGYLVGKVFLSTHFRYADLYTDDLSGDILFLGNSRGVHMFHRPPLQEVSGQRVANLSFNALPATMLPVVLTDYLENQGKPSRLFIEVTCIGRVNEPGSLERFTVLSNRSVSFNRVLAEHRPMNYAASRISHLYRYNSDLMLRSLFFLRSSDQDWMMDSVVDESWRSNLDEGLIRRFETSFIDLDSVKQTIAIAEENGIDVELILAPYLPDYIALTESCSSWVEWIEEETGKEVLDYSLAIEDANLFADPIHLNPQGAAVLAKRMHQRGDL